MIGALFGELVVTGDLYSDTIEQLRRREPMRMAAEMLRAQLPPLTFATSRTVIAGILEPCYDVGGDAFDYAVNGDTAHLALFDAVGHGSAGGMRAVVLTCVAIAAYRSAKQVRADVQDLLVERLGDPHGVLIPGRDRVRQKGTTSVGVQRQYTGTAGRIGNSQVAAFLAYAGASGRALLDRRLYLPERPRLSGKVPGPAAPWLRAHVTRPGSPHAVGLVRPVWRPNDRWKVSAMLAKLSAPWPSAICFSSRVSSGLCISASTLRRSLARMRPSTDQRNSIHKVRVTDRERQGVACRAPKRLTKNNFLRKLPKPVVWSKGLGLHGAPRPVCSGRGA